MTRLVWKACLATMICTWPPAVRGQAPASTGASATPWKAGSWRPSPGYVPRRLSATAFDPVRRRVLTFGGLNTEALGDTWEWDGSTWRELLPESSPPARFGSTLTFDENRNTLVLFGGARLDSILALDDMWEWTGRTWRPITPAGGVPPARFFHAACFDGRLRRIVLHGGFTARGALGPVNPLSDTWSWDGSAWVQANPPAAPAGRGQHAVGFDSGCGRVVLFGGHNGGGSYPPETWLWDGVSWTQLPNSASTPPTLIDPHLVKHPIGPGLLLAGAQDSWGNPVRTMWEWRCGQWTQLTATTPSSNVEGGWAFDSQRGRVVFSGGRGLLLRATWEWDGTSWTLAYDEPLPPRDSYSVSYHADVGFVAVFALNQVRTWVLRDDRWQDLGTASAIPSRSSAAWGNTPTHDVQYHARSRLTVMHGGFGGQSATPMTDTWVWDPAGSWREHVSATPPTPRPVTRMAYDAGRDCLVMFSGGGAADTWEWNPAVGWSQANPSASPPPRSTHAIGYDPSSRRTVIFGGGDLVTGNPLRDTWEWDGSTWQQVPTPAALLPRVGGHLCYAPWLGGLLLVGGITPSTTVMPTPGVWIYRNRTWSPTVGTPPHDRYYPVVGLRYDSSRQIVRAFRAPPGLPEPYLWDLSPRQLTVQRHLLGPGESLRLHYGFPELHGGVVATVFALGTSPGIPYHPVPLVGTECLPLSADPLFFLSARLGLVSLVDATGVATLTLPVAQIGGADPLHLFVAGAVFDLATALPLAVSNPAAITLFP